jgi:hypothetical protein
VVASCASFGFALLAHAPPAPPPEWSCTGSVRERYEWLDDARWGEGRRDRDGYWLHRALLRADWRRDDVRACGELQAAFVSDRAGGPRPTDEDRVDLHQAFVELRGRAGAATVAARLGRQELSFGSSRLVSVREGPNVRLAFDGVRTTLAAGGCEVDAFALRPVEVDVGEFDDDGVRGQRFFGVHATRAPRRDGALGIDAYCLRLDRDAATFQQGVAAEHRWSLGARVFGAPAPWDYDLEAVWQTGRWGNGGIAAWTIASDVGWQLPLPATPRLGVKVDVASGDRDPATDSLQTFHALFPRGSYFGEPALVGPANLFDVHPSLAVGFAPGWRASVDCDWFWRQSRGDGLYGSALAPLRPGTASPRRHAGSQLQALLEWRVRPNWTCTLVYARFFAGAWLADTGAARDVDYVSVWTTVSF